MQGPFRPGTLRAYNTTTYWERGLRRGNCYRVITQFNDADGAYHPVGEQWYFVGSTFGHYYDELVIFVAFPNESEWKIPMKTTLSEQKMVVDKIGQYIETVPGKKREELFAGVICAECHHLLSAERHEYCPTCGSVWDLI